MTPNEQLFEAARNALQWFVRRNGGPVPNSSNADLFIARELSAAVEAVTQERLRLHQSLHPSHAARLSMDDHR